MNKLFTLGCSLTWNMGWKEYLSEYHNFELVNSSMFAGSNNLQVRRIHSYIVNDQISKDDVIIWQITSLMRHSFCVDKSPLWDTYLDNVIPEDENSRYYIDSPMNYFDSVIHRDVLSNHPMITRASRYYNAHSSLEELISTMILLNHTYKILVFVGWEGALKEDNDNYDKVIDLLEQNDVPHFKESFMDWAIRCKQPLADDLHPSLEASEEYGKSVIYPKLQELGWI